MYESSISNPGHSVLSFQGFQTASGSGIVLVSPPGSSSPGTIDFTNVGSSTTQIGAVVEGYFTDGTDPSIGGDTYVGLPWTVLADTRTGWGVPEAQLRPSQSITVSMFPYPDNTGVAESDVAAAEVDIGALSASNYGYLNFAGLNGSPPLRSMLYIAGEKDRLMDVIQPDASGNFTITNEGPGTLDIQVILRGYFVLPDASEAGSSYAGMDPVTVCDTRQSCSYNGTTTGTVPANGAVTIQESGVAGIPTADVAEVANEINAVSPQDTGYLTVDPAGTSSPTTLSAVNFQAGDNGDESADNTVVSQLSNAGAITVTNHSSGTVQIVVSAQGYWLGAVVPDVVQAVDSNYDGTNANVIWSPPLGDGGATITGYILSVVGGGSDTVSGSTTSAAIAAPSTGSVTVAATNAMGTGVVSPPVSVYGVTDNGSELGAQIGQGMAQTALNAPSTSPMAACSAEPSPAPVGTISGTVSYGSANGVGGQPVVDEVVHVSVDDSGTTTPLKPSLGSVTTDANGCFWYTLPSSFPTDPTDPTSEVPGLLTANGGFVNLVFQSNAAVQVNGVDYPVGGYLELPDSTTAGGNDTVTNPVVNLLPLDAGTPTGGTVLAATIRAEHLARRLAPAQRHELALTAERNPGAASNAYHFQTTQPYNPYDVNGVNLQHQKVVLAGGVRQLFRFRKTKHQPPRTRPITHGRFVPNDVTVAPWGGGTCWNVSAADGQDTPSNAVCVAVCNETPTVGYGTTFGWLPAAETHTWSTMESGDATIGTATTFKGEADVSAGLGPTTVTGGYNFSHDSAKQLSFHISDAAAAEHARESVEIDLPIEWNTSNSQVDCAFAYVDALDYGGYSTAVGQQLLAEGSAGYGPAMWDVSDRLPNGGVVSSLLTLTLDFYRDNHYGTGIGNFDTTSAVNNWVVKNSQETALTDDFAITSSEAPGWHLPPLLTGWRVQRRALVPGVP